MDPLKNITTLPKSDYPYLLKQISRIPDSLDMIGTMPPETYKYLCVVGSRSYSSYGRDTCEQLITGLTGYPIVIVSGLALGIDSIAHESALRAGLRTIAFPGSGLDINAICPVEHIGLAHKIVEAGGTLLSQFKRWQTGTQWTFPARNRLMAGISQATLIIEADEDSGTLLTAGNAGEFNRDLLVVTGSIFSPTSKGSNQLLRDGGMAITSSEEILEALGLKVKDTTPDALSKLLSPDEKIIAEKLSIPTERDELIRQLNFPTGYATALLIELELKGVIIERQGLLMIN
jgi:DNA processing protein